MIHPYSKYCTITCCGCGTEIIVPVYCGNRFCPECNVARQVKIRQKLDLFCSSREITKGVTFKFLTLTIKSQPDLKPMVDLLLKSFRKLRQRKLWKNKVFGGAFVIEMTLSDGSWHPHIHAVIEGHYIPYKKLLEDWTAITGDTGVFIQMIPVLAITRYLTKYITKTSLDEAAQIEASEALKGKRLFQPFGSWHSGFGNLDLPKTLCRKCGQYSWEFGTWSQIVASSTICYDMPEIVRGPDPCDEVLQLYDIKQTSLGFEEYIDAPF